MTTHKLSRKWDERREYRLKVVDGELETVYEDSQYHGGEPLQTVECTCGERFVKEENAIQHVQSATSNEEVPD